MRSKSKGWEIFTKLYTDITEVFSQEDWDNGNGPLPTEWQEEYGLVDVTQDPRWFRYFESDRHRLGIYFEPEYQVHYIVEYHEKENSIFLLRVGDEDDVFDELGIQDDS